MPLRSQTSSINSPCIARWIGLSEGMDLYRGTKGQSPFAALHWMRGTASAFGAMG